MSKKREHRSARVAAVAEDGRTLTVRAVTYNVVDDYGSVFIPGVFNEALEQRLPVFAWSHDWSEPIGRAVAYEDHPDGLDLTVRLSDPDAVPRARQAMVQFAEGTLEDVSVGFSNTTRRAPTRDEETRWPGIREVITKADLDETSAVLRGAVPGAKALSIRSGGTVDVDAIVAIAKRKAAGELTDEEARIALDLLSGASPDEEQPPAEEGDEEPSEEDEAAAAQLDADLDAALSLAGRSRQ